MLRYLAHSCIPSIARLVARVPGYGQRRWSINQHRYSSQPYLCGSLANLKSHCLVEGFVSSPAHVLREQALSVGTISNFVCDALSAVCWTGLSSGVRQLLKYCGTAAILVCNLLSYPSKESCPGKAMSLRKGFFEDFII